MDIKLQCYIRESVGMYDMLNVEVIVKIVERISFNF